MLQALWHEKEGSEELRVLVHRLKNDLDNTKSLAMDTQVRGSVWGGDLSLKEANGHVRLVLSRLI